MQMQCCHLPAPTALVFSQHIEDTTTSLQACSSRSSLTFLIQGSNPGLPHCRQMLYCLSHQGSLKKERPDKYWTCPTTGAWTHKNRYTRKQRQTRIPSAGPAEHPVCFQWPWGLDQVPLAVSWLSRTLISGLSLFSGWSLSSSSASYPVSF